MQTDQGLLPEWSRQQAVLLAWPHAGTDWQPWLAAIQQDYLALAEAIACEATPLILCPDETQRALVATALAERCRHAPRFAVVDYNDTWCRDYGPLTVREQGALRLKDFQFQGWGDKYDASLDNQVTAALAGLWQPPVDALDFELEGGSIETDGAGTLLTTRHCLLESGRNEAYNQQSIEALLKDTLGQQRILWLGSGMLLGDDTDSHIDNLARFCSSEVIAYAACNNPADEHHAPLQAMQKELQALSRPDGSPYTLVPLEIPGPQLDEQGHRLPASYANFLILNDSVIVPVFGCAEDARALNALQRCFPGKTLRPVPGNNLIRQFGGPHCATMQLPVGLLQEQA